MSRISFYVSRSDHPMARLQIVCKLAEKAWSQQMRTHIVTDSMQSSQQIDDLLWTWKDDSFLPHARVPHCLDTPICIDQRLPTTQDVDFLINLSTETFDDLEQYQRVADILDQRPDFLNAGRKRYVFYRNKGYTLDYYKL